MAQPVMGTDLPIDADALLEEHKEQKDHLAQLMHELTEAKKHVSKLEQELEHRAHEVMSLKTEVEAITAKHIELQTLSKKTFDRLTSDLDAQAKLQADMYREELIYPILTQTIISHKLGLIGDKKKEATTKRVVRWLQQRVQVIVFLRDRNLFPELTARLELLLQVDADTLIHMIDKCHF